MIGHSAMQRCFTTSIAMGLAVAFSACSVRTVAKVDELRISEKDVTYNVQVLRNYYPDYNGDIEAAALKQLVDAATLRKVLQNNGREITDKDLEDEAARIDRSTLLPERLNQIKAIFGNDRKAYLRVYVLNALVQRVIYYEFFLHDPKIQAESRARAQEFLDRAIATSGREIKPGGQVARFVVSLSRGLEWQVERKGPHGQADPQGAAHAPAEIQAKLKSQEEARVSEEGKRWINDVISHLKPGEFYRSLVDRDESWWVVRYLKPKAGAEKAYEMEATVFPKADYPSWLERERAKVRVEVSSRK